MTPMLSLNDFRPSMQAKEFPIASEDTLKTFNGSAALHQLAVTLGLESGDVVLLPAYCCGAEIGPFLHIGCRCEFFDVDEKLNVDIRQIEYLLDTHSKVKALMITHYFGFSQDNLATIAELCNQYNITMIEDCAHALFSCNGQTALGAVGQCAIFSPRKSLPLTEGGLLVVNHALTNTLTSQLHTPALLPRYQRLFYSMQQNLRSRNAGLSASNAVFRAALLSLLSLPATGIKIAKKLPWEKHIVWLSADAEGEDAIPIYNTGMSALSISLMHKAKAEEIITARRHHYNLWLDAIKHITHTAAGESGCSIKPLLPELPDGCCPLYFPVIVQDPAFVKQYLADHDVECFNWWQHRHDAVNWSQFPVAEKLKRSVVALPVHQKLNVESINRAANYLEQSLAKVEPSG